MNIGLSLAGAALCLAVLYFNLKKWWDGNRELKNLIPFAQSTLMGALATLCTGGILGWLSGCTRQGVSTTGDQAVRGITGAPTGAPMAAQSLAGQLTPEGGTVVAIAAAITFLAYKVATKEDKRRIVGGLICGMCLTITAGVAGALDGLPGLANDTGAAARSMLENGSL